MILTRESLQKKADPRSFARGEEYLRLGRVLRVRADEGQLLGRVQGVKEYRVRLYRRRGHLTGTCSCPQRRFCKHCVAVGLSWLATELSDPRRLAERVLRTELDSRREEERGLVLQYLGPLGAEGLAAYRELARKEWARVPQRLPGADPPGQGRRQRLAYIMETLAWLDGDMDALVAVKSRDLSSPQAYVEIAEIYQHTHRPDWARHWAERGLEAFPGLPHPRLLQLLQHLTGAAV